jgi:hypothetical protein
VQTLRSVDPLSAAKVWACVSFTVTMVSAALSLIVATLITGGSGSFSFGVSAPFSGGLGGLGLGDLLLLLVVGPFLAAVWGFVYGLVAGFTYNVIASSIGGLKLTLSGEDEPAA